MKFLCVECDARMEFEQRALPGDGTFAAAFRCPTCGRRVAMLANPMETQLVEALGVEIGGRTLDQPPLALVQTALDADERRAAGDAPGPRPTWSAEAAERLARVPAFVRGMVKRIYADYARERGIGEITPAVMDRARAELGLEGM